MTGGLLRVEQAGPGGWVVARRLLSPKLGAGEVDLYWTAQGARHLGCTSTWGPAEHAEVFPTAAAARSAAVAELGGDPACRLIGW